MNSSPAVTTDMTPMPAMSMEQLAEMTQQLVNLTQSLQEKLEQSESSFKHLAQNSDSFFLIINAIVIYFMQCGFAFLECGAVRSKNATNILLKNMLDSFIGAISYWIIGWPLAFGKSSNEFVSHSNFVSAGFEDTDYALWFFHFVFAATAATIVSGAVAERCDFYAYVVYSTVITGIVYPIVTHWAWDGSGWLSKGHEFSNNGTIDTVSYQDFAGSGVVHLLGGMTALIAAAILGPRLGRFDEDGRVCDIKGHSVPWAALGGFILFFGFFAFNGGSQASMSQEGDYIYFTRAVVNTIIAGSFAAVSALVVKFVEVLVKSNARNWSLLTLINGGLTGMVAACAGCNMMYPWGAAVTGVVAGLAFKFWSWLMVKIRVDDPLDAVAVHMGGGLWGVIAAPIFNRDTGVLMNFNKHSWMALGWNFAGAAAIIAWSSVCAVVIFGFLRVTKLFRVSEIIEYNGLDIPKHDEPAYPVDAYGDGWGEAVRRKNSILTVAGPNGTVMLVPPEIQTIPPEIRATVIHNALDSGTHINGKDNMGYQHHPTDKTAL